MANRLIWSPPPPRSRQGKTFVGASPPPPPPPILKSGNFLCPQNRSFTPTGGGGLGGSLSLAEGGRGGHNNFWGTVVFTLQLEVLAILKAGGGGVKKVSTL